MLSLQKYKSFHLREIKIYIHTYIPEKWCISHLPSFSLLPITSLFFNCMQKAVTSVHLSWDVGLKKPKTIQLVYCINLFSHSSKWCLTFVKLVVHKTEQEQTLLRSWFDNLFHHKHVAYFIQNLLLSSKKCHSPLGALSISHGVFQPF